MLASANLPRQISLLDLATLLSLVLDQLSCIVDYTSASLLTFEGDNLVMGAYRSPSPTGAEMSFRVVLTDPALRDRVFRQTQPLIIDDLYDETSQTVLPRQAIDERLFVALADVRSVLWIPLVVKRRVIGGLGIAHAEPGHYDASKAALAQSLANQAVRDSVCLRSDHA